MLLCKQVHESNLQTMKSLLDLGELVFSGIGGRESGAFRHYREQVMGAVVDNERRIFSSLEQAGLVERCDCGAELRRRDAHGNGGPKWERCPLCAGCGYRPKESE